MPEKGLFEVLADRIWNTGRDLGKGLFYDPAEPLPANASGPYVAGAAAGAALPFLHGIKDLKTFASGVGRVPLYHGTSADNAAKIMKEGIKLPQSGFHAAQQVAERYGIPLMDFVKYYEGRNPLGYGGITRLLSSGPFPIAERWANPKSFPQGEMFSQFNETARLMKEAKRRGTTIENLLDTISPEEMATLPDLMKPRNPTGVVLGFDTDVRNIRSKAGRWEAQSYLKDLQEGKVPEDQILKFWNNTYQDFKVDPRKIKELRIVKGSIEGPEG